MDPHINAAELDNKQLIGLAQEVVDIARDRGLELSLAAGVVAVEGGDTEEAAEVPVTSKESLAEQLPAAIEGYEAVLGTLNQDRPGEDVLPVAAAEVIAAELDVWLTEDKLAYINAVREADPAVQFTLVATPNVFVDSGELFRLAEAFDERLAAKADSEIEFYEKYTAEELSGTDPDNGNAVVFSLVPSSDDIKGAIPTEMRSQFSALKAEHTFLKVPSPLEAIAYWQALRAGGDEFADGEIAYHTHRRTSIVHFNLPGRELYYLGRMRPHVPDTGVWDGGQASLFYARAEDENVSPTRVAVG